MPTLAPFFKNSLSLAVFALMVATTSAQAVPWSYEAELGPQAGLLFKPNTAALGTALPRIDDIEPSSEIPHVPWPNDASPPLVLPDNAGRLPGFLPALELHVAGISPLEFTPGISIAMENIPSPRLELVGNSDSDNGIGNDTVARGGTTTSSAAVTALAISIPEPSSLIVLGGALAVWFRTRRRQRQRA